MATPALALPDRLIGQRQSVSSRRGVSSRREAVARPRWLVLLAVLATVVVRVWFLRTNQAALGGDEAITGIMVQRILHGHSYVFYLGQTYNGTLDQYLQALMYLVLPLPVNAFTLRLIMVGYAGLDCVLIYLVGARMLKTRWHAAFASLLFALGPYWNIWLGTRSYGSLYTSALVVALVGLYAALRLTGSREDSAWWAGAFGLCCGLDIWLGVTGAYLLLPAGVWVLASAVRSRRIAPAAIAGLVVGSAPVSIWIAWYGRLPNFGGPQPPTTFAGRAHILSGPIVREWLGVGYVNDTPGWPPHLQTAAVVLLALAWLIAVVVRRRGLAGLLSLWATRREPIDVLVLAVPIVFVLYCSSPNAWGGGIPRYLTVAYPLLVIGLAALLPRRASVGAPLAFVLLAGFAGTSLTMVADHAKKSIGLMPGELHAAVSYLVAHDEVAVYSDYWSGMPLQFAAGDRLAVGVESGTDRLPGQRQAVDSSAGFVYMEAGDPPGAPTGIQSVLDNHHVHYHLAHFGVIDIFDDLQPMLRPWQLGIGPRLAK